MITQHNTPMDFCLMGKLQTGQVKSLPQIMGLDTARTGRLLTSLSSACSLKMQE